jgi:N-acetylglucosaminyldiphosphoundecaprenol N-acetyl-beta-D-mannosaminyltransferase
MSSSWLEATARELQRYPAKIVALCLGSPKQERLFADLQATPTGISGAYLCVGAAIDFAAGTVPRAPKLVQDLGLEWLHRLLQEPRRLWRRYLVEDVAVARYFVAAFARRASRILTPLRRPTGDFEHAAPEPVVRMVGTP